MSAITSVVVLLALSTVTAYAQTWTADNGAAGLTATLSSSTNFPIPAGVSDPGLWLPKIPEFQTQG